MDTLVRYRNGNYQVTLTTDGTKTRETQDTEWRPEFAENIDVKITDYCDAGCRWCHEGSTKKGKHADTKVLLSVLQAMPQGTEVAIGGGNPLSHPDLEEIVYALHSKGVYPNVTINQHHVVGGFPRGFPRALRKCRAVGLSYSPTGENEEHLEAFLCGAEAAGVQVIFHLIAGVHDIGTVTKIVSLYGKTRKIRVLVLGYKDFRRGATFKSKEVEATLKNWFSLFHTLFPDVDAGRLTVNCDNLACEQLKLKRFYKDEAWKEIYLGDDGHSSFYIDFVKSEYARHSFHPERHDLRGHNVLTAFKTIQQKYATDQT